MVWIARLAVGLGVAGFLAVLAGVAIAPAPGTGTFEIVDVVSDGSLRRHAAVARIELDDGQAATALYLVEGDPPERGGRERPRGAPVAVWTGGFVRLAWDGRRLRVIGDQAAVRRQAGGVGRCLAEPSSAWQLCLDTDAVTFAALPR